MAEADQELFNLIVEEFTTVESPENCHPLREWIKDIVNVLENLRTFRKTKGRKLAHIRDLKEALTSAEVFLRHFNCKTLFAYCQCLLSNLIAATDLKEVDDEVKRKR
jgi:NADH:ubiquinone oxidoreductase subunit F (NADH-binding)